ncbi:MAG: hypothetical protein KIS87_11765 [Phycisphaeraceae bacterium]|nr:hypothetical protein [Phycisphaeraceae bacterium]
MSTPRLARLALAGSIGLAAATLVTTATAGGERCHAAPAGHATLGPPLVCVEIEIGDARSLPWGKGAFDGAGKSANPKRIADQTLALLSETDSTLVRMETLRRATVYMYRDESACAGLLARLAWIALDREADAGATDAERARAWFDAGYFAACLWHMNISPDKARPGFAAGVQGYAWLVRAIDLSGGDPAMEFAAANAAHPGVRKSQRDLYEAHMRRAIQGVGDEKSLLRMNIDSHLAHWNESADAILRTADSR